MRFFAGITRLIFGLFSTDVVGSLILFQTAVSTYQAWQTMKSWQSVTAELFNVTSHENDTKASYHYSVAGQNYQSEHLYVVSFRDNIGSYHEDMYEQFKHLKISQQPGRISY